MSRAARAGAALILIALLQGCFGGRLPLNPERGAHPGPVVMPCLDTQDSVAWRVRLQRGRRDSVFTVVVERGDGGVFRVAALNDVGGTLFQATSSADGLSVQVERNNLPMPNRILAQTFVQDALLPFLACPPEDAAWQRLGDGRLARMTTLSRHLRRVCVHQPADGAVVECYRVRGRRIAYHARLNTPGLPFDGYAIQSYRPRYSAVYRPITTGR